MASGRTPTTVAIVSTFHPENVLVKNCTALMGQCDGVIVVDDGSSAPDEDVFTAVERLGCTVLRLRTNAGIAAALNRGIELAQRSYPHLKYILTMDQDSLVEPAFVRRLVDAASSADALGMKVGMIAPGTVSGLPSRARRTQSAVVIGDEPVQSGLLIPVSCLDEIGPFNEELFIDGVDSEFYLRAKAKGLQSIIAPLASLTHSLGSMVPARLGPWAIRWRGEPLLIRIAASWRYYFIVRNRLVLCRRFAVAEPKWVIRGFLGDVRHILLVTLLAPGRQERLEAAARGFCDGVRGRTGPMPAKNI